LSSIIVARTLFVSADEWMTAAPPIDAEGHVEGGQSNTSDGFDGTQDHAFTEDAVVS
jgi:hypothetical protein